MQTTTSRFDFGITGAVSSCPPFCGYLGVSGDVETNHGARDVAKQQQTPVAAWLSAISVAKARIARLIITIHHREAINAAVSNASSCAVQSLVERTGVKSRLNVYKLSI
jgi:hypothetical protein